MDSISKYINVFKHGQENCKQAIAVCLPRETVMRLRKHSRGKSANSAVVPASPADANSAYELRAAETLSSFCRPALFLRKVIPTNDSSIRSLIVTSQIHCTVRMPQIKIEKDLVQFHQIVIAPPCLKICDRKQLQYTLKSRIETYICCTTTTCDYHIMLVPVI